MISEWLQVMLEEIERKRAEREQALAEERRRQLETPLASLRSSSPG